MRLGVPRVRQVPSSGCDQSCRGRAPYTLTMPLRVPGRKVFRAGAVLHSPHDGVA
jgi:hypothetical protein